MLILQGAGWDANPWKELINCPAANCSFYQLRSYKQHNIHRNGREKPSSRTVRGQVEVTMCNEEGPLAQDSAQREKTEGSAGGDGRSVVVT